MYPSKYAATIQLLLLKPCTLSVIATSDVLTIDTSKFARNRLRKSLPRTGQPLPDRSGETLRYRSYVKPPALKIIEGYWVSWLRMWTVLESIFFQSRRRRRRSRIMLRVANLLFAINRVVHSECFWKEYLSNSDPGDSFRCMELKGFKRVMKRKGTIGLPSTARWLGYQAFIGLAAIYDHISYS